MPQYLLDTLKTIAMMQVKPDTDHAELTALMMSMAKIAVELSEANGMQAWR